MNSLSRKSPAICVGFSLVELMVAMLILSAITVISSSAYSLFIRHWDGNFGRVTEELQASRNLNLLYRVIGASSTHVFKDEQYRWLYFKGTSNQIFGYSEAGIFNNQKVLYALEVSGESGARSLTYFETTEQSEQYYSGNEKALWQKQRILINEVAEISFSYIGWESLDAKTSYQLTGKTNGQLNQGRFSNYDAKVRGLHPDQVLIFVTETDGNQFILRIGLTQRSELAIARFDNEFE